MPKKILWSISVLAFFLVNTPGDIAANAKMQSNTYRIPTSVLSGGGAPMSSPIYKTNFVLAQPSPLMDTQDPPFSDNYDLYPGYWYTIGYWEVPKRAKTLPLILLLLNE